MTIEPASAVLLYSDGVVEAHDPAGELYGFPRIRGARGPHAARRRRDRRRAGRPGGVHRPGVGAGGRHHARVDRAGGRCRPPSRTERRAPLAAFEVASDLGNERHGRRAGRGRGGAARLAGAGRRPAADRRRRGDDERDRARQRVPLRGAGAPAGHGVGRRAHGAGRRPGRRRRAARRPRRPTSRRSSPGSRRPAGGVCT